MTTIYVNLNAAGGENDGSSEANGYTSLAVALAAAADNDTLFFSPGDYTGVAIDIGDGRALTFTSANAGDAPDAWTSGEVRIDRISTLGELTVDGIHVHATLPGAGFVNGGTWEAIGVGSPGNTVTVINSILSIDGGGAPSAVQGFGLNITYDTDDIVVDHVHIGPFEGGFADPNVTNYGMWLNGTSNTNRDITVTNNVFETGSPRAVAVAFDGQIGGPQIDVSGNQFENPGTAPGAIRVFDFGNTLSGTQDYTGITGNDVEGGGPTLSNETGGDQVNFGGADEVSGTTGDDTFIADVGNDSIDGGDGNDTIDMVNAGSGGSVVDLDVGAGGVAVSVATGLDTLASIENVKGSAGADYIAGDSTGNDLAGLDGDDHIQGRGGNDHIDGGAGEDTMTGGDGDDTYVVDNAGDTTVEGSGAGTGTDTVQSSVTYTLAANVENLTLTDVGTGTENFENFSAGEITNGENGWKAAGVHDQEVEILAGNHVFRMSSDPASGDFGGPYSPDIGVGAGESTTSADGNVHVIKFVVKPVSDTADNSRLEVDFGNVAGTDRNNFMVIENYAGGVRIAVTEPDASGNFVATGLAPNDYRTIVDHLSTTEFHQIELRLTYVDGPNNDLIEIFVDGAKVGETSTFENYHDTFGAHDSQAELNQTNRIFFRAGANGSPQDGAGVGQNQGFYFDDINNTVTRHIDGTGNALNNTIIGNSGDNVLTGAGGDDTVNGGGGTDTASYAVEVAVTDLVYNANDDTWTVDAGTDGNDTLSDVEIIDDASGGRILLVGGDAYPTIQAAIDAAADGDTIIVAQGTYNESVTVNKDVTLLGANFNHPGNGARGEESVITGGVLFTAAGASATLNGFDISGTSGFGAGLDRPVGVLIGANNVDVSNNVLTGSAADTRPFDAYNGAEGFTVHDNLITGWSQGAYIVSGTSGTIEDNIFEHNGNGVVTESTNVVITGNTFSESEGAHIAPLPFVDANIGTFVHDNIFLDQDRPISVYLNGAADNVTGSDVAEAIHGEYVGGPVTIDGAGGNDHIIGSASGDTLNGGAGDDTIDGGAGADTMDGGANNDTYIVDNSSDVVNEGTNAGTDTVRSSVSYTIADADVENLTLVDAGSDIQDLEDFTPGLITDNEHGWNVDNTPRANIVADPADASNQVLLISSNPHDGTFGGPYTPDIGVSAGEPQTTADGEVQVISFRVKPFDAAGDNSRIEVDFANQNGGDRNSFMVIESTTGGVRIAVADSLPGGDFDTGAGLNDFSAFVGNRTLVSGVDGSDWLNLELRVRYVDGADNDVVDIYLDGVLIGQSNTFENYRDSLGGTHSDNAEANQTSRILLRGSAGPALGQAPQGTPGQNQGFYFDDLTSTVTSNTNGTGNNSANVINGNSGHNILLGLGGNDTLNGGAGDDTLDGGADTDTVNGGDGNDTITVAAGDNDIVDGGSGTDTVNVIGGGADETVHAVFTGSALISLGGNVQNVEAISLNMAGNTTVGDTLDYTGSTEDIAVNLALGSASGFTSIAGVENVIGGSGSDSIIGNGLDNVINGGGGSDFISGGGGSDTVVLDGDFADYAITASGGSYIVNTESGTDIVSGVEKFTIGGVTVDVADAVTTDGPSIASITDQDNGSSTLEVDENTASATLVATAAATDPNLAAGLGDHLTYTLQTTAGGAFTGPFSIDADDGQIRVNGPLNFETATSYTVKVVVTDAHGNFDWEDVVINIGNLNDSNPVFSSATAANVNENAPITTVVYDAKATDADAGFGDIVYSLSGADRLLLDIDANDGEVRLKSSANFEAKSQYLFNVVATQGLTSASRAVTLSINDVNEGFGGLATQTVSIEAGSTQASLGLAALTDPQNDPLFYKVTTLPGQGTVFLNTGVAVGINKELTEAQFLGLKYSSLETASNRGMQFLVTDGHGTSSTLNLNIIVTAAVNGTYTGNGLANRLDGAGGNDFIDGRGGADVMFGGSGNDRFVVDNAGDRVFEGVGKGTDLVYSSISLTLAANVESLVLTGTAANGRGNILNNQILGNASVNQLFGDAGNDTLYGYAGNDALNGGVGNDALNGGVGNDALNGGVGNDVLTGGANRDVFVFNSVLNSTTNRDRIVDFSHADDALLLDNAIFSRLGGTGAMDSRFFHQGTAAADANDYIIYNRTTGFLSYDADANRSGAAVVFAVLANKPAIAADDFVII